MCFKIDICVQVVFLRACLAAWNNEIEKKPPSMSIEEACDTLAIKLDDAKLGAFSEFYLP